MASQNTGSSRPKTFKKGPRSTASQGLTEAERLAEKQAARQLASRRSSSNRSSNNRSSNSNRGASQRRNRSGETPAAARIRRRATQERRRRREIYNDTGHIENQVARHADINRHLTMIENKFNRNSNYDESDTNGNSVPALARNLEVGQRYSVTTKKKDIPTDPSRIFEGTYEGIHRGIDTSLMFTDIFVVDKTGAATRSSLRRINMRPNDIKKIRLIHRTD